MLIRLVLNEQQRIFFRYNQRLLLALDNNEIRSGASSSDDELSYKVSDFIDPRKVQKRMEILKSYKAVTDLDKLLLKGIFKDKYFIKFPHATNSDI